MNITHSHRHIDFSRNSEPFRVSGIEYIFGGGVLPCETVIMSGRPRAQVVYGDQTGWEKVIAFAVHDYLSNQYDVELVLLDDFDIDVSKNDLSLLILIVSVLRFGRQLSIPVFVFEIVASFASLFSRIDRISGNMAPLLQSILFSLSAAILFPTYSLWLL